MTKEVKFPLVRKKYRKMKEPTLSQLEHLFEQKNCLMTIFYDYIDEKILHKAIKEINKEIWKEIKRLGK